MDRNTMRRGFAALVATACLFWAPFAATSASAQMGVERSGASVSASEYAKIKVGMTKSEVHAKVGGNPMSSQKNGKHLVEVFKGWDSGAHAKVKVTFKKADGGALEVTGKKTIAGAGGGGGGGGGGGPCCVSVSRAGAAVSASEYAKIKVGMTKSEVHAKVGGNPMSSQKNGKHLVEVFKGWDSGAHAKVKVTFKKADGGALEVTGKKTIAGAGGGGGGGGGGGPCCVSVGRAGAAVSASEYAVG